MHFMLLGVAFFLVLINQVPQVTQFASVAATTHNSKIKLMWMQCEYFFLKLT